MTDQEQLDGQWWDQSQQLQSINPHNVRFNNVLYDSPSRFVQPDAYSRFITHIPDRLPARFAQDHILNTSVQGSGNHHQPENLSPALSPLNRPEHHIQYLPEMLHGQSIAESGSTQGIKSEPLPDTKPDMPGNTPLDSSPAEEAPTVNRRVSYISISSSNTEMPIPPPDDDRNDNQQLPYNRAFSPESGETSSTTSTPPWNDLRPFQIRVLRDLQRICTLAARNYWASRRPLPQVHVSFSLRLNRSTPYDRIIPLQADRQTLMQHTLRQVGREDRDLSLDDCLMRINDQEWECALARRMERTQGQEDLAVCRMNNLYRWKNLIEAGLRQLEEREEALSQEEIQGAVMGARDMCVWFLCEEGRIEVERIWREAFGRS